MENILCLVFSWKILEINLIKLLFSFNAYYLSSYNFPIFGDYFKNTIL